MGGKSDSARLEIGRMSSSTDDLPSITIRADSGLELSLPLLSDKSPFLAVLAFYLIASSCLF